MTYEKKYGVMVMVVSVLLTLFALMLSDGWIRSLGFFQALMNTLEIRLIEYTDEMLRERHLIEVDTKYVVLVLLTFASYGFTTYLGITPAYSPWKKDTDLRREMGSE